VRHSFRTSIPDEFDGKSIVFANVFERSAQKGVLSVLLLHDDRQQTLTIGEEFELGTKRMRLEALEPHDVSYLVSLQEVEPADQSAPSGTSIFPIVQIGSAELVSLLKTLTPAILAQLGRPGASIADWSTSTEHTMHAEWNGGAVGPVTTTRHMARFAAGFAGIEADIAATDVCFSPDRIERQELAAFWRADQRDAHVFARAEGTAPIVQLLAAEAAADVVAAIAAAVAKSAHDRSQAGER